MRWFRSWLSIVFLALSLAACGGEGKVVEVVVPEGTGERLARGEVVEIMPAEIYLEVGDTLRIRNDDVVFQAVGPYTVAAGTEFEITYGSPGRYEGLCALSPGQRYEIVVTE